VSRHNKEDAEKFCQFGYFDWVSKAFQPYQQYHFKVVRLGEKSMNARKELEKKQAIKFAIAMAIVFLAIGPELAMAAPWDGMGTKVLSILNNGLTRTAAIIAVIACGIAGFAGKLSWDWAIKIVVGMVLVFGAAPIVDFLIAGAQG